MGKSRTKPSPHPVTPAESAPHQGWVKKGYLNEFFQRQDSVVAILDWVNQPDAIKARIHRTVIRFGLIPSPDIDEYSTQLFADFIFDIDCTDHMDHGMSMQSVEVWHTSYAVVLWGPSAPLIIALRCVMGIKSFIVTIDYLLE